MKVEHYMQIYKRGTLSFDHIMKRGTLENSVMTGEISDRRGKRRQKKKIMLDGGMEEYDNGIYQEHQGL